MHLSQRRQVLSITHKHTPTTRFRVVERRYAGNTTPCAMPLYLSVRGKVRAQVTYAAASGSHAPRSGVQLGDWDTRREGCGGGGDGGEEVVVWERGVLCECFPLLAFLGRATVPVMV